MNSKFTLPLLISICFAGGYAGAWMWRTNTIKKAVPLTVGTNDQPSGKPDAWTHQTKFQETQLVAPTLENLIEIAGKGSPIVAEAAVIKLLNSEDTGTLAKLFETLCQRDYPPETSIVLRQGILRCWGQADPAGTFQAYLRFPDPSGSEIRELLAVSLSAKGWGFCMAQIGTSRSQAASFVMEEIIKWTVGHDPEHVVEALEYYLVTWDHPYSNVVATWAAKDRAAAENWITKQPNEDFLNDFTEGLAAHGLAEARAWIENRSDAEEASRLQGHLIDWAINHCSLHETIDLMGSASEEVSFVTDQFVERWAQKEPEALWDWIQSLPETNGRRSGLIRQFVAFRAASAPDWDTAVALANKLPTQELREMSLSRSLMFLDPMVISQHFDEVPPDDRHGMFSSMLWNKSKGMGVPVDRLLELMPKVEFQTHQGSGDDYVLSLLALRVMAEKSPEEALEFAKELPSEFSPHVTQEVFKSWVTENPQEAAAKAIAIAEQSENPMSALEEISTVIRGWRGLDPKAVDEWIASIPPGNGRDVVAWEMVTTLDYKDPVQAVQWLQELKNEDMRSMLFSVKRSANPSKEWREAVQGSSLSTEDKKTLLSDP
jgi:hypothetical protein